jgi:hypothetical protein
MAVELFGSRVSTCLISILLIVYGSFRSLNMEQEAREKEKRKQSESSNNLLTGEPVIQDSSKSCFSFGFIIFSHKVSSAQAPDLPRLTQRTHCVYRLVLPSPCS